MILDEYLDFLRDIRRMSDHAIFANRRNILTIEKELGKPVLEAQSGSEIDRAIISASKKRRMDYNGGRLDNGFIYCHKVGGNISRYFTWAYKERLILHNIYVKNSFPEPPTREAGCLTDEQLKTLYSSLKLDFTEHVLIRFFFDTGLRVGQVVSVHVEDINFIERSVKVYVSKTDQWHTAPISESTIKYILKWLHGRKTGPLFPNRWGKHISTDKIRVRFRKISKKIGFRVHPHIYRHTATTKWVELYGQVAGMQFACHKSIRMTNHYTHLLGKKKVEMQKEIKPFSEWNSEEEINKRLLLTKTI